MAVDKFMPEMHLRQPGFTYSAYGSFSKNKEQIEKFKVKGYWKCVDRNEIHKVCFQHDMPYVDFKGLPRRTVAHKISCNKAFKMLKIQNMDIKLKLLQTFIKLLMRKLLVQTEKQELIWMYFVKTKN